MCAAGTCKMGNYMENTARQENRKPEKEHTGTAGQPIRILHVLGVLNMGGAESRIMDLYRHIDRQQVQFDFLVHTTPAKGAGEDSSEALMAGRAKEYFDDEVRALGGEIYALPRFNGRNLGAYRKAVQRFFASHSGWAAVEGHMTSTASIYLPIAKANGIPATISHVRSAGVDAGLKGLATRALRAPLSHRADHLLACSVESGISAYGQKVSDSGRVRVIPNALEIHSYAFEPQIRAQIRREYGIPEDAVVLGHVGRFDAMKNHGFLVQLLEELTKQTAQANGKTDFCLLFVGKGKLEEEIRNQLAQKGLSEKAVFAGQCPREQTARLYQAMDLFCFPSLYEGVPGTVIEAQAAGLPCLISDRITKEVCITEAVESLPLESAKWAERILQLCAESGRETGSDTVISAFLETKGMQEECEEQKSQEEQEAKAGESKAEAEERIRAARSAAALEALGQAGFDIRRQARQMQRWYQHLTDPKLMLLTPMLHQGGFERVCVKTARLLEPYCQCTIVIFDDADIAYDITGLQVINLHLGAKPGKAAKILNLYKRVRTLKKLKKEMGIDIAYSFGQTANLTNCYANTTGRTITGIRSYLDLDNPSKIRLFCQRSDAVACCSAEIEQVLRQEYHCENTFTLYNPIADPLAQADTIREKATASGAADIAPAGETDYGLPEETASALRRFLDSHDPLIMSMGREDDVKGFWHLVKAFSLLEETAVTGKEKTGQVSAGKRPGLVLIGEGDFAEYKKLAADLHRAEDVFCTGVSTDPSAILQHAGLYVLSSIHEGFPNALLEAMALGVPVIAADCKTGPREILAPAAIAAAQEEEKDAGAKKTGQAAADEEKKQSEDGAEDGKCPAGEYGILLPPLSEQKDLSAANIPAEDRGLAEKMQALLTDDRSREKYSALAKKRAADFAERAYTEACRQYFGL